MMKKILWVSFYFPPLGAIASLRALKLTKYLARMGYRITVLCASPFLMKAPYDGESVSEIPAGVKVHRALYPDPAWIYKLLYGIKLTRLVRWMDHKLFFPGSESLWLPFAKIALARIMKSGSKPDIAVLSSGPPAVLKLALYLKERYGIPYIIDWRDEWINNHELINLPSSSWPSKRDLNLEKNALKSASGCAYLTSRMRDNFYSTYGFLSEKPCEIIPNGFDEEDFKPVKHQAFGEPSISKIFTICFSGRLYGRLQPDPLWQALLELTGTGLIPAQDIRIEIRGDNSPAFVLGKYRDDPKLNKMVKILPYLPYRQNLRELMKADALLLYIPSGTNTDSVLTGKLFDYLPASKPVLAVIPPRGLAAQLLTDAGIGFIASDTDAAGIKDQLLKLYEAFTDGSIGSIKTRPEILPYYARSTQAQQFAALIDRITL